MKIVQELNGSPYVFLSAKACTGAVAERTRNRGAYVDLAIVDVDENGVEGDTIQIEGTLASIKSMLLDALEQIESTEEIIEEDTTTIAAREKLCPKCSCYYDPDGTRFHADGKGGRCAPV